MSAFTFPIGTHTPPQHAQALPDKVDVVIIGGGVIGICAALFLRRHGQSVFVCEKDVWQANSPLVIGDGYVNRDATLMSCPS